MQSTQQPIHFNDHLRKWRNHRKLSQLDLALTAEVSQRHVSWLETGKSHPSRDMIIKLSEALNIPLRERNSILNSAGFAKLYSEQGLTEPSMEPVTDILNDILAHHNPFPAIVVDRHWNIKLRNDAAILLLDALGDVNEIWPDVSDNGELNIALLTVHPKGFRRIIRNWDEVAPAFISRLKKEAVDSEDASTMARFNRLLDFVEDVDVIASNAELLPVLPLEIDLGDTILKLCSVISTFGTAQDITANEIRIETFYPADELSRQFFKNQF